MSMKSIVIKIVAGLTVIALLIGAIVLLSIPENETDKEKCSVYSYDADKIRTIEVKSEDSFALEKTDDGWIMAGMEDIRVIDSFAKALAVSMSNVKSPMIAEKNAENLSVYGLDKPVIEIKLVYDDFEETVVIGERSGEYNYLKINSNNDVYIVRNEDLYMAFLSKMDYVDKTVIKLEKEKIEKVCYGDVVLIKEGQDWKLEKPYERMADNNLVEKMVLDNLQNISATDIVKKDSVRIIDRNMVKVHHGENVTQIDVVKAKDDIFVLSDESEYAYKVSAESVNFINVSAFELMNKYVAPIQINLVNEIEFKAPGFKTVLSIEAPSSEAPVFYKNGEEVTEESFRMFYQILMGLTFKAEGEGVGAAEYAIIFRKENGEAVDIRFINYDEDDFAVSIDGKTQFTVAKKAVTDIFGYLKNIEAI